MSIKSVELYLLFPVHRYTPCSSPVLLLYKAILLKYAKRDLSNRSSLYTFSMAHQASRPNPCRLESQGQTMRFGRPLTFSLGVEEIHSNNICNHSIFHYCNTSLNNSLQALHFKQFTSSNSITLHLNENECVHTRLGIFKILNH